MGCCSGCGQVILVLINILFSLVGGALFSVACVVRFGSDLFDKYFTDAYTKLKEVIQTATGNDVDLTNLDFGDLLGDATIAFMVLGLFFFLLGIVGCIGACCKQRCLLVTYVIVLATLFLAEVTFVVLLYTIRDKFDNWVQDPLVKEIKKSYTGTNGTDGFTLSLNFIMHELDCCGIESYTDFQNATKWHGSVNENGTVENYTVPLICCKETNDTDCAVSPNNNNSNIDKGCYAAVDDWLIDHSRVLIGVGAGVAGVQLLLIIFAIVTCCSKKSDGDDDDSYRDDIPIHPYREESRPAAGGYHDGPYREPNYGSHKPSQHDHYDHLTPYEPSRGGKPYPDEYPQPYRGRSDPYNGPPADYRSPHYGRGDNPGYR